jgi:hypothetical protein
LVTTKWGGSLVQNYEQAPAFIAGSGLDDGNYISPARRLGGLQLCYGVAACAVLPVPTFPAMS